MTERRVAVTGMGGVSSFGETWEDIRSALLSGKSAVRRMPEWEEIEGLNSHLAAPARLELPAHYTRKKIRGMGRVSLLAVRAAELALERAGLLGDPCISDGSTGIAFGSCTGSVDAVCEFGGLMLHKTTRELNATSYIRMMPHTAAVNAGLFFGVQGRLIPTSSACTSGSQAIGYAYESIKSGAQDLMIAGGAEELSSSETAVFDTLFAASTKNETPQATPRPFDRDRDGLVIGEGGAALVLEEFEHAKARGAEILAEVAGFATNCDATHVTLPNKGTMCSCMEKALRNAGMKPSDIGYINGHGTGTLRGDAAESQATAELFGSSVPFSTLKGNFGHTLGACGALETWLSAEMMREGWFAPTLNLEHPAEECGVLDYIMKAPRELRVSAFMTNNFAFGGVNTSLIFRRV